MMDKYCEFCVNLRSVVYCKADAAYLCLSCDTKVHSANPLSNRHYRTLICDFCRRRPTYVRCYDHQKFMCRVCDHTQHNTSSQHRKRVMNSYMGCPSARDLGLLWGFDMNQFIDCSTSTVVGLENNVYIKEMYGGMQAFSVLQQLVDLLKVQTSEVDHILRCQEPKVENEFDRFSQQFLIGGGCPDHYDISLDPCSSPFTQLDHLESSSQLWSQNMQDLGVCEEPSCVDDLNIPDIDLTFRNFEELFRIEQEPKRVDRVNAQVETFSNHPKKNTYERDTCMDTSVFNTESSPKKARYTSQTMSSSHSRLSVESSGTVCFDSGTSIEHHEPVKAKGKKSVQQKDTKQGRCGYRKARSDTRKRTKSQSWKFESHESVTRSC